MSLRAIMAGAPQTGGGPVRAVRENPMRIGLARIISK
jgi:hypothetical protein